MRSSSVEPRREAAWAASRNRLYVLTISLGQICFALRRLAQVEMRSAALLNADVENGLAVIATHGFQMRFDNARDLVQFGLGIALGRRQPVAFANAQSFADLGFGNFTKTVKVENIDTQVLRM